MENMYSVHLKISKVENDQYLAESDDVPGLVAQGRTISEAIEIAQDVARKIIDSYIEHGEDAVHGFTDSIDTNQSIYYQAKLLCVRE
ncbi:MAG: type II toxin-antitoxin system HicB family antitoxin [Spirochaetales bacterium]|nr:type II toxin-antitoxin system HicB family antitoxin [Spirochaetales bacterium]